MDDGIRTYTGRCGFAWRAVLTLFFFWLGIEMLATGAVLGGLILLPFGVAVGHELPCRCLKVELRPRGALVLHKFLREQRISVRAVQSIELRVDDEGSDDDFLIRYEGGSFVIGSSGKARALVDAIIERNPAVEVSGNYRARA